MKPFLYRLVTVFCYCVLRVQRREIVLPGSGGDDSEKVFPFSSEESGHVDGGRVEKCRDGRLGKRIGTRNPLTGIGICVTKQNSSGTEIFIQQCCR